MIHRIQEGSDYDDRLKDCSQRMSDWHMVRMSLSLMGVIFILLVVFGGKREQTLDFKSWDEDSTWG